MLIPLICRQCGGKLEVEQSHVYEAGDTVIVLSNQTFNCPHCGTKYLPGEKIKHASEQIVISIGGESVGSTIIIGNGNVINNSPGPTGSKEGQETKQYSANLQSGMKEEKKKPPKKWWQFWKM